MNLPTQQVHMNGVVISKKKGQVMNGKKRTVGSGPQRSDNIISDDIDHHSKQKIHLTHQVQEQGKEIVQKSSKTDHEVKTIDPTDTNNRKVSSKAPKNKET